MSIIIEKLLENSVYDTYVIPNEDDEKKPGRLLRVSNEFKKGANKGKKSKYFLIELLERTTDLGEMERGRIVFPVMELTDAKRYKAIARLVQKKMNVDNVADAVSTSDLVALDVTTTGSFYKAAVTYKDENNVDRTSINFFVHKSENQSVNAIQTTVNFIKANMEDRGCKFEAPEPPITANEVTEQAGEVKQPEREEDPFE